MRPRVLVTRPQREAQEWVRDLSAQGLNAVALPLIQVGPVDDPAPLAEVGQRCSDYAALMFVSGNAVDYFFASQPAQAPDFGARVAARTRTWAPGPGTARALLRAGVPPERIDAPPSDAGQFDSEALWRVVAEQVRPGDRVLIVRGGDRASVARSKTGLGREWLASRLVSLGAMAEFAVAYERFAPWFSPDDESLARLAATDGTVWLLSSSEALLNLTTWLPGQDWTAAQALVTHPRIAAAARAAGFGRVHVSRPTLPDVVASLQHLPLKSRHEL